MQVICDCGKKFYLADGSDSQICDRCGQKLGARGSSHALPKASGSRLPSAQEAPMKNLGKAAMTLPIEHLEIASSRKSHAGLGCAVFFLAAIAIGVGADFFVNPAAELQCGHVAKDSYLYGLYREAHRCEAIEAVRYLERMREAVIAARTLGRSVPANISSISTLRDSGTAPQGPYEFLADRDYALTAVAEGEPDLPSFHLTFNGSLYRALGREAGPSDELIRVFE